MATRRAAFRRCSLGLYVVLLNALAACCASEINVNRPFQVVRPTANHSSMLPVPESLAALAQHDAGIAIVSVVGPYHSGKSFLLNALLGNTQVFQIGRRTSPETMGIWLCRTNLTASDGSEVWLMDSEGFFGPGVEEGYDAKIFTIATLLGAHLVYNTVKVIDQQAVNLLEMLARRAQLFRTRSSAEGAATSGGGEAPDRPEFLSVRSFPPLTWVVEDFVQELPEQHRHADGATSWLMSYLAKVNTTEDAQGEEAHFLAKLYSELTVKTLFLPATSKEHLQDLSRLSWGELTPEFRSELSELKRHIFGSLEARKFEGRPMTGRTLERALRFIVQGLQRGMFHELPSLWATWTSQVAELSLQDAETWFASMLATVDTGEDPISIEKFNLQVESARERAIEFYKELLRDFEVRPDATLLQNRMAGHFQHKLLLYHERIQRWVGDMIARSKDVLQRKLSAVELPVDPELLRQTGDNVTRAVLRDFNVVLSSFAARGAPVKLGRPAQMPAFSQDPSSQLVNDLRAIHSTRELENEREIAHYFKQAFTAADEAVEAELRLTSNKILGKARMQELKNLVAIKCGQAFDERLDKYAWMQRTPHYSAHKALVKAEAYETRMSRFATSNEQRLVTHFRTVVDRCTASYRTRRQNLAMPVSEADLEAEHRQLWNSVREMLEEQGRDLADTEAYRGAWQKLSSVMEEGLYHSRQKNVELWKVHSDEATRCALQANHKVEKSCGLFCLFNKVPKVHKSVSHRHLMECFPRTGAGARLSPSLQLQVFEDWYNKELAHDAATVWNNFVIGSMLIGLLVLALVMGSRSWSAAPAYPRGLTGR